MNRDNFHQRLSRATLVLIFVLLAATAAAAEEAPGTLQFSKLGDFTLENGEVIRDCRIGYRTFGALNADKSNAVLVPTWFTGKSQELAENVGTGKMLDPQKYFIILVDALGNGVSSSPSNSTLQPKAQFPKFTIRDMVNAEYLLATKELGLVHLKGVAGLSMGGMQTFQWAVSYPDFLDRAAPIIGTPQQTSFDLLLWRSEADSIVQGLHAGLSEAESLSTASLISAMLVYTPEFRAKTTSRAEFEKYYQEARGDAAKRMNAYDYLRQLQAMIAHDVAGPNQTLESVARATHVPMLVIVSRKDHMVNPSPAQHFAEIAGARALILESDCGHLAAFCEANAVASAVSQFLTER